jgi:hypothetical protein
MYINGSSRRTLQDGNRRLVIERLMLEDSKIYTAEVTQTVRGKVELVMATITLNVHGIYNYYPLHILFKFPLS